MSGSSKILVDYVRHSSVDIDKMTGYWIDEESLSSLDYAEWPQALFFSERISYYSRL